MQLHNLDDLINQRRLVLSELKNANHQRLDATRAPSSGVTTSVRQTSNLSLHGYYQQKLSQPVIGEADDFITSPEIDQLFGH